MESSVATAQYSCSRVVRWKAKVASSLTERAILQQLFEQQDITVMCTIHFHPSLHENHTCVSRAWRYWLKPTCRNMIKPMSMSWSRIWLKHGQQPAQLY